MLNQRSNQSQKSRTGGPLRTAALSAMPAVPLAIALVHAALTSPPSSLTSSGEGTQMFNVPVAREGLATCIAATGAACEAPYPMVSKGHAVNWWFVFKLNVAKFPGCGGGAVSCPFGGDPQDYKAGLQYVFASSANPELAPGSHDCLGEGGDDPVAATFEEVYRGAFHYVVWNDQFYGDPESASCGGDGCGSPWGHSKGLLAWNDHTVLAGVGELTLPAY